MAKQTDSQFNEIREAAENNLLFFINLVAPHRVLGSIHEDICQWWDSAETSNQLLLCPRDHQKSALIGYRVAQQIAKDPTCTFLYVSATATLAQKQLYFIKTILESKVFRYYWPKHINAKEGQREKWTNDEICIDHPVRKREGVRDSTIFTAGIGKTITGLHFTHVVLDDLIVNENAYTEEARAKVASYYSLLASVATTGAREWIVGTRYHPNDLYSLLTEMKKTKYDEFGNPVEKTPLYDVRQYVVEDRGDGTGEFLWPRQQRADGKWFGFNVEILSEKKEKYLDKGQFYAQYYNNPNDPTGGGLSRNLFQYYDKKFLESKEGDWYYMGRKLNIYASIDFAFSLKKTADYTAIVVIGVDLDNNIYVLDIDRFRTDNITDYFKEILELHSRWGFRKLRAEVNVSQGMICKELRDSYIKKHGLRLSIDEHRPTGNKGSKEERMKANLYPRYENMSVWHYRGGNCQTLEEELRLAHPPHDDVKDALSCAVEIAVAPSQSFGWASSRDNVVKFNSRFGGVSL